LVICGLAKLGNKGQKSNKLFIKAEDVIRDINFLRDKFLIRDI
jgi:hypothetical protein